MRQDHWALNPGHCGSGLTGFEPDFADGSGLIHSCGTAFAPAVPNPFGYLIDAQADDIAFFYAGSSEIGTGVDPSPKPTRFFVGLPSNRHEHLIAQAALATEMQHSIFPNQKI